MTLRWIPVLLAFVASFARAAPVVIDTDGQTITLEAGHPSLQKWKLPAAPVSPEDNMPTWQRIDLGRKLFFDPHLSGDGSMSCASCHDPRLGWSDGRGTSKGVKDMTRASPTIFNIGFNTLQMWDGRKKTLEAQAMGPMESAGIMNADTGRMFAWLAGDAGYHALFEAAYPGRPIDADSLSKALAAFERTVVSNDSPFDRWVAGHADAMTAQQVRGFALFIDPKRANCAACHAGANFTDNGFHNLGLASYAKENPDVGRFAQKPIAGVRGAFKTPTVRESARTAPYFHDGSAATLDDVIAFYVQGGIVKTNLSKNLKPLTLDADEADALVAFLNALSTPTEPSTPPH